jgi:hypothetical protein
MQERLLPGAKEKTTLRNGGDGRKRSLTCPISLRGGALAGEPWVPAVFLAWPEVHRSTIHGQSIRTHPSCALVRVQIL